MGPRGPASSLHFGTTPALCRVLTMSGAVALATTPALCVRTMSGRECVVLACGVRGLACAPPCACVVARGPFGFASAASPVPPGPVAFSGGCFVLCVPPPCGGRGVTLSVGVYMERLSILVRLMSTPGPIDPQSQGSVSP